MESEDSNPLITVIIPVYNAEKYLRRGLDSLLAQTCGAWEAVCIDDGSCDNSLSILKEYAAKDARFRVLTQENSGVSAARNRGIREACGEWVTFLDADDWLSPELVEKLLTCPCSEKTDIIGFSALVEYEKGTKRDTLWDSAFRINREEEIPSSPEYLEVMLGTCWGKAFKRSFLIEKDLAFPVGMRQEDEVFYRCAMGVARHVYLLKYPGYQYLQAAESYMHQHTDLCETFLIYLKGARIVHSFYVEIDKSIEWKRSLLTFLYRELSRRNETLNWKQMRELRRHTQAFMEEIQYAELDSQDYRVRFLSTLPWWEELFSHRGWDIERFKFLGLTYRKDYYKNYKLVRRTTPWMKIKELLISRDGENTI